MSSEETCRLRENSPSQTGYEPEDAPRARQHWRAVLGGQSPREVLARMLQGDPLDMRVVVSRRLTERAYLFDADRVHLRALAHCARRALRYRGNPPLETWLAELVDLALFELLREDAAAERRGSAPDAEILAAFVELARPLGLEPTAMGRVCLAHNLLREPDRQAFYGLVIAGRSLEELAKAQGVSGVEIARRARHGLEAVLIAAGQLPGAQVAAVEVEQENRLGAESTSGVCASTEAREPECTQGQEPS